MAVHVVIDTSDLNTTLAEFAAKMMGKMMPALRDVGDEILRLSAREVPHDIGLLQASAGRIDGPGKETVTIGYNKSYAAKMHEHPEYHFQKGRKGKYLEDPIKNNTTVFLGYIKDSLKI